MNTIWLVASKLLFWFTKIKRRVLIILISTVTASCGGEGSNETVSTQQNSTVNNASIATLGEQLFLDPNLSFNRKMSCSTCHNPQHGFIDDRDNMFRRSVSMGANDIKFGTRNAPTIAYARFSPNFSYDPIDNEWFGGQFHDGRAMHLTAQVNQNGGPILNPNEMMMPDRQAVIQRLQENKLYVELFKTVFGRDISVVINNGNENQIFSNIGQSIAAFEIQDKLSPFDSKFDRFQRSQELLSESEARGWKLVQENCMACHNSSKVTGNSIQTFSNYRYYNLGVPVNQQVRDALESSDKDPGLFGNPRVSDPAQSGKFKTPTLRNVAITAPYMHNGTFDSLKTVILFKQHRANTETQEFKINPETNQPWGKTDYPDTIQYTNMNIFSEDDITDIISFLRTLTDQKYEYLLPPEQM